jgi:hypothetical protein
MSSLPRASRRAIVLAAAGFLLSLSSTASSATVASKSQPAPETFHATARVGTEAATGKVRLTIRIDQYTPQPDIDAIEKALGTGGSDGFLEALRKAPIAGHLEMGDQTFTIRWARQRPTATGRVITLVTDAPVYFVGGGVPGARARTGYDVAVLHLTMDSSGVGKGTMAAAARVKPGGPTGVEVEDYATEPLKLSVSLAIS